MVTPNTALYVPPGKGLYVGNIPGNISSLQTPIGTTFGGFADETGLTIGTGGFVSSLINQPQNVFRLTGAGGTSYIQGSNIAFALPFSGTAGVRIFPSTNSINVNNLNFVYEINALSTGGTGLAGAINMAELTSSIKGYGWATVGPSSS